MDNSNPFWIIRNIFQNISIFNFWFKCSVHYKNSWVVPSSWDQNEQIIDNLRGLGKCDSRDRRREKEPLKVSQMWIFWTNHKQSPDEKTITEGKLLPSDSEPVECIRELRRFIETHDNSNYSKLLSCFLFLGAYSQLS